MSKAVTYIITFLVIFVALPIGIYTFYFDYQDGLYPSLVEYDSYTTKDGKFDVKTMKYNGVGGEETYVFKLYLVDNDTNDITFIKTVKISSYGTAVDYVEDDLYKNKLSVLYSASGGKLESVEIDTDLKHIYGKKLKGNIF